MRERVVAATLLVAVLAILLFGLPLAIGAARYYAVSERTDLSEDAETGVVTIEAGLGPGVPLPPATDVSAGSPTALYDVGGTRLSGTGPDRLDPVLAGALSGHRSRGDDGEGDYLVAMPVRDERRQVAVLRAERPDDGVLARTGWTWAAMLGLALAAVAVGRAVAGRLGRRMSGPLEDLAADAARIGEGDFTVRGRTSGVAEIDAVRGSLQHTAGRLSDLLDRERAFSTEASHQLRTPLTGLRLRLEEAATLPPEEAASMKEAVEGALAATDRLDRTVTDLLRLARSGYGTRGSGAPLDVAALVEEVVAAQTPPAERAVRVAGTEEVQASASPAAARQILGVLLENALAHGAGAVTVEVRGLGAAVAVDVADEGRMSDGADPFATIPGNAGHGIGLSLARRLAETEGGRLRLRCADPTTFTLLLKAYGM